MKRTLSLIFLFLTLASHCQSVPSQSLTWFQYKGGGSFGSSKWGAILDVQHRRTDLLYNTSQHLIRPGITYKLGNQFVVTAGFAMFWHNITPGSDEAVYQKEIRPFQFLKWQQKFHSFQIKHKLRFEQRFNEKTEQQLVLPGYIFNYRIGYRIEVVYPLAEQFVINAYEEIMINFGKEIIGDHLDQNRIYIGIRYKKSNFTYKTGYMWLAAPLSQRAGFENRHIIRVGVSHEW